MEKNKLRNVAELYREAAMSYAAEKSFLTRNGPGQFDGPTYKELYDAGLDLSAALIEVCRLQPKEHVAILADNRIEWMIADYAVILAGAADVPRGTDATEHDIEYIVNHAGCRIVVVENQSIWEKFASLLDKLPGVEHVVFINQFSYQKTRLECHNIHDLIAAGKAIEKIEIERRVAEIKPDDLFTLIYTSGTTGAPKGVMLTHGNIISQIRNLPLGFNRHDVMLSILPIWHIFERAFEIISIASGAKTVYTNVKHLKADMQSVKPTFMASAPRLWESIYNGILTKVAEGSPIKRALFHAAISVNHVYRQALREMRGQNLQILPQNIFMRMAAILSSTLVIIATVVPALLLDAVVLSKIRAATGGRLRATISGGGALPLHIDEFFNDIGIAVLEGYGMTETSPIISVRLPENAVIGSVGPLYSETEIRLVDIATGATIYPGRDYFGRKGELHVKGPQVMAGYYKNPEATAKVLKNGWMNTGDLAIMTANGCLKIVGRSKETIVLMNGENVEPVPIESKLLESPLIEQCMVVGQDQKFLAALIVPRTEALKQFGTDLQTLAQNAEVKKLLKAETHRLISGENGFKAFERIGGIAVMGQLWEKDRELTAKLSLRRHVITELYEKEIQGIFE
ncbi:AMP-dependent synthetase/ligase [Turneriella parva]|uniref:AMP-dependent synthetase and ligase n=1 Tax=Turneriella parva (strain ATCC BAA-1111 / DSM 21527 / NCTC 11395 / H) TaxID=869212 RepID=I4B0Q4_TURPD|nr:AMP-binding protein [Turneriella parva]AFM10861.1 AMP-dependent synthetase and ligase [Turneriella parva DSM 21527]